jgi:AcrR family transcriptional regulator
VARPRSARAHDSVLDAALALFAERGIDATSMDAIAERSGVSKATIYKHWPDKDALCLEVMGRLFGHQSALPDVDTGDLRADLMAVLGNRPRPGHDEVTMRMMPHLMAHAARNPAFARAWQARAFDPPRVALMRTLDRAMARGELPRDLNRNLAIALLIGPMMYEHVLRRWNREASGSQLEEIVDMFLRAHRYTAPRERSKRVTRSGSAPS